MTEALVRELGRTMGCPRCGERGPRHAQRRVPAANRRNVVAANPYEAKRRCAATGNCNDEEIGARAREAYVASNAALRQQRLRSTSRASRCQAGDQHERRRDGH